MVVYVIGLGSMGRRRIGLLREIDKTIEIIGIDADENRRKDVSITHNIRAFLSVKEAMDFKKADCALVCTSPISHSHIIEECLSNDMNVFTEINLVPDGYEQNISLAHEKNKTLFISSTFLYRKETQYIEKRIKDQKQPLKYIYHAGQYLPDWHPWESYKGFFVGNKRTNGCRELLAIELPWLISAFGEVKSVSADCSKISSLELEYPDSFFVKLTHSDGSCGLLAVDVVSRKAVRRFEVYNEDIYLTWDGTIDSVCEYDISSKTFKAVQLGDSIHKDGYADFISENPYYDEIKEFLDIVSGDKKEGKWSFEKDKTVLDLIDNIEGNVNDKRIE